MSTLDQFGITESYTTAHVLHIVTADCYDDWHAGLGGLQQNWLAAHNFMRPSPALRSACRTLPAISIWPSALWPLPIFGMAPDWQRRCRNLSGNQKSMRNVSTAKILPHWLLAGGFRPINLTGIATKRNRRLTSLSARKQSPSRNSAVCLLAPICVGI